MGALPSARDSIPAPRLQSGGDGYKMRGGCQLCLCQVWASLGVPFDKAQGSIGWSSTHTIILDRPLMATARQKASVLVVEHLVLS